MTLELKVIDCDSTDWSSDVVYNFAALQSFINSLDVRQTAATAAVASEVGTARGGKPNLGARLDGLALDVADAVALSESVVFGDQATMFDPAASYISPKLVIYDGDTYRCLSSENVIGILPTDKTVWKMLTNSNKAETPNLILKSGSANMGTTAKGRVLLDYDANLVWNHNLPNFAVVKITDVDDEDYIAGKDLWEFSFKAPIVTVNTIFTIKLAVWFGGVNISDAGVTEFTSIFVPVQDGPTMAFANTVEAFPGATIDAENIQPPAFSIGAINEKQIVSAIMQALITSGKIIVHSETSNLVFKTTSKIVAGERIITDQGFFFVGAVSESGGVYSCSISLPGTPSKAYKDPIWDALKLLESFATSIKTPQKISEGDSLLINGIEGVAGTVSPVVSERLNGVMWDFTQETGFMTGLGSGAPGNKDLTLINAAYPTTLGEDGWRNMSSISGGFSYAEDLFPQFYHNAGGWTFFANVKLPADPASNLMLRQHPSGGVYLSVSVTSATEYGVLVLSDYGAGTGTVNLHISDKIPLNTPVWIMMWSDGIHSWCGWSTKETIPTSLADFLTGNYMQLPSSGISTTLGINTNNHSMFTSSLCSARYAGINKGPIEDIENLFEGTSYTTDITSFGLTTPPQYVSRKLSPFALAAGPAEQVFSEADYNIIPEDYTAELSDSKLILTAEKIELTDDPDLKKLAMSVKEPVETFIDAKIYIQERMA